MFSSEAVADIVFVISCPRQGCQMVYFETKNPYLGTFWRALECKVLLYFMITWNFLWPFGIIYGSLVYLVCGHLVYFSHFGTFWTKKHLATLASVNPSEVD
jgi:hypothetical protein